MSENVIFTARKIVTMNPANPEGTAIAIRDGKVLAVGSLEECQLWGPATIDDRFTDKVLIPGFVEAHGHTADGMNALLPYVGFHDYPMADGSLAPGVRSYDELIERLKAVEAQMPPGETLLANSFDPIYFDDQPRLDRTHLDQVSTTRPIFVRHASGHLATVNTALLEAEGITADTDVPGVDLGDDGQPSGELQEAPAMNLAKAAMAAFMSLNADPRIVRLHAEMCRNGGVTTSSELAGAFLIMPQTLAAWQPVIDDPDFPARMVVCNVPAMPGAPGDYDAAAATALALRESSTDRLRHGAIKLVIDGSLQGWTAKVMWPGYLTGEDQGLLLYDQEELNRIVSIFHRHRLRIHCHCNGNGAVEAFIQAVDSAVSEYAWLDHRHVVEHSQTTTPSQYRRMGTLRMTANIFINHVYYWGDQHARLTMGPDRARGMWACRTALAAGVPIALHSDSGVTPVGGLRTMWCAVNRVTASGQVLGEYEKLTPYEALHAATLGGAYQLHMDDEIGSLEAGKAADFAVLDDSPLDVEPMAIKDIPVWGTVVGGTAYPAATPA